MESEDWHNILAVLAVVILADQRVYKEEVDTFIETSEKLNRKISPDIFMTKKMAFDWFLEHRDKVEATVTAKDSHERIDRLLERLSHLPGKRDILRVMFTIARCDNEYHLDERHIIKRAARMWNLPMPRQH